MVEVCALELGSAQKNGAGEHGGEYSEPTPSPKGSGLEVIYNIEAAGSTEFNKSFLVNGQ